MGQKKALTEHPAQTTGVYLPIILSVHTKVRTDHFLDKKTEAQDYTIRQGPESG